MRSKKHDFVPAIIYHKYIHSIVHVLVVIMKIMEELFETYLKAKYLLGGAYGSRISIA